MTKPATILIIGGYGSFGSRLAALLETEPDLTVLIGGRSEAKAAQFCEGRTNAKARLVPLPFDRGGDLRAQLAAAKPDIVVDASGPFQIYGANPYAVVAACIEAGIHYLDLADAADFVAGIGGFDAAAVAAGVFCLSGVSTCPALTGAAVRHLSAGMGRVTAIAAGIAPSPFVTIGPNVVRAIASYAGQTRMTADKAGYVPFTETRLVTIAPPGAKPMRARLFANVEAPEMRVLPRLWPGARIWVGAGTEPRIFLRALMGLAWLVRRGVLRSLLPFAPVMYAASRTFRWGENLGGMFVRVEGRDGAGEAFERSWHLIAEGDNGPFIPTFAAAILVRRWLAGDPPAPGARDAAAELELADFAPYFAARGIRTG